jgi:hypothetical protein
MRDSISNMQVVRLGKQTLSGSTPSASAWVDMRDFDACALILTTDTVTVAGTAGFTATLQHGDTTVGGSAVNALAADSSNGVLTLSATLDTQDNVVIGGISYVGARRYARFNIVGTTNTNAVVEVYAILERATQSPTTLVGASVAAT